MRRSTLTKHAIHGISPDSGWGYVPIPDPDGGPAGGDGGAGGGAGDGTPTGDTGAGEGDTAKTFTQADLDQIVKDRLARETKKYADYNDLKAKATRLAEIEAGQASETEKAVKKAQDETRAAVAREYGEKAAGATILAHLKAAGVKDEDADAMVDDLNLSKYVGDDGVLDAEAITKTLARITPKPADALDLGQGGSGGSKNLDQQIADATKNGNVAEAIRLTNQKLAAAAGK